jgi:hypothetical protein
MAKKSKAEMSKQKERTKTMDKKSKAELTERLVSFAKTAETDEIKKIFIADEWKKILTQAESGKKQVTVPTEILASMTRYILRSIHVNQTNMRLFFPHKS